MSDPILTTEEAATHLGVSVANLYESRRRGQEPGILGFRRGKRLMWRQSDLDGLSDDPESFGVMHALVLEIRGINKRLDRILAEVQYRLDRIPKEIEDE